MMLALPCWSYDASKKMHRKWPATLTGRDA
jgi:hypothetical protein